MTMKLWLDDERPSPPGWIHVKTASQAMMMLESCAFVEVSLDHDLGDDAGDGHQVICWLEERVATDALFPIPIIHIHTANASARLRMLQAVANIERHRTERKST